jgi:DNA modification methylase
MGRRFIGFEINPAYCELARCRVEETVVQPSLLEFFV